MGRSVSAIWKIYKNLLRILLLRHPHPTTWKACCCMPNPFTQPPRKPSGDSASLASTTKSALKSVKRTAQAATKAISRAIKKKKVTKPTIGKSLLVVYPIIELTLYFRQMILHPPLLLPLKRKKLRPEVSQRFLRMTKMNLVCIFYCYTLSSHSCVVRTPQEGLEVSCLRLLSA
jgi:hypothetical protein